MWVEHRRRPQELPARVSNLKVTHTTELAKVDMAFRLLRLDNAYVCNAGRLVGVITRDCLRDFIGLREIRPMDECMRYGSTV